MMQKYQDSSLSPEERASDLLARMNLDEKFGQIQCYNAIDSFLGKSVEKQNPCAKATIPLKSPPMCRRTVIIVGTRAAVFTARCICW